MQNLAIFSSSRARHFLHLLLLVCSLTAFVGVFCSSVQAAEPEAASVVIEAPININRADAATLASVLKGVGAVKAQAIIEWREQHGDFTSIEQLLEVKGIGEKTLERNRLNIVL